MRGKRFAGRLGIRALIAVFGAAVFLAWPGSAQATVHDYYGPYATGFYGVEEASGWNNPDTNRVYRPLGYYYTVYYTDGSTAWATSGTIGTTRSCGRTPAATRGQRVFIRITCTKTRSGL